MNDPLDRLFSSRVSGARAQKKHTLDERANESLTCFSSRSRGTCCAVILERLAENCRGRTTAIICTRTNAPKYILESHRLHFGSICDQNGRNFEPCLYADLNFFVQP